MTGPIKLYSAAIVLLTIITNFCLALASPMYWIENPTQKYQLTRTACQTYFSHDTQIIAPDQRPVYTCPKGYSILDFAFLDDNQTQLAGVLFTNQAATFLEIYDLRHQTQLLVRNMTFYHPWKIQFADVDGDTTPEVCLGVYKKSPLHSIEAKRLFIFNFQQGLQPKWLGSKLARPFIDFTFITVGRQTTLISLEVNQASRYCLNSYQWDSFGFMHVDTGIRAVANQATTLRLGYQLQSDPFQPQLFLLNETKIIKVFNLRR